MYKLSVNCASGVENILKRELTALGFGEQKAVNGSFVFDGVSIVFIMGNGSRDNTYHICKLTGRIPFVKPVIP